MMEEAYQHCWMRMMPEPLQMMMMMTIMMTSLALLVQH